MYKLQFMVALICLVSQLKADDPLWLSEVALPAQSPSDDAVKEPLPKLANSSELEAYRSNVLRQWSNYLGTIEPSDHSPRKVQVLEKVEHEPGLTRSLIEYETEPGQRVQAFVLEPSERPAGKKLPGVVIFHSTVEKSIFQPVGLSGKDDSTSVSSDELRKAYALHLARRGFITLSPRNFLWPTNIGIAAKEQASAFHERQPKAKGMARMLLDSVKAVDVLCNWNGVDNKRLGAIGHSLGAKEVLYLAAFDERIVATVSSEGGLGIAQSNWDAPWYLGAECTKANFVMDHHQLLAAVAPRAFLLIGGEASDGSASMPYLIEAQKAFVVSGKPAHLGFYNHKQGHHVTDESLARSIGWLEWQLK